MAQKSADFILWRFSVCFCCPLIRHFVPRDDRVRYLEEYKHTGDELGQVQKELGLEVGIGK